MHEAFGFHHFLTSLDVVGRGVLGTLFLMSVASWSVMTAKLWELSRLSRQRRRFLSGVSGCRDLDAVAALASEWGEGEPFGRVTACGFMAAQSIRVPMDEAIVESGPADEWVFAALRRAVLEEEERLEGGVTLIATVSSAAPFVGLLGTVWSIYHALVAIGLSGEGGLDKVAGPVGEALVMTGIGLLVAIPALLGYNALVRMQRVASVELERFSVLLFTWFVTGNRPTGMSIAKRSVRRVA